MLSLALLLAATTELLDPDALATLEQSRWSFSQATGAAPLMKNDALAAITTTPGRAWHDIATVLADDLARFESAIEGTRDDTHGFIIRQLATSSAGAYQIEWNGDAPRQLDRRWLTSPLASLKLVAVVPRYDRRDFDTRSPCGEVRFIYRLAYATERVRSTLPFFVNVVMRAPADTAGATTCRTFLDAWRTPASAHGWLAQARMELKQIEVNFQSLRFSAGYMTDFGGQALYIMRIFQSGADGAFAPVALENTPHTRALAADPALRAKAVAFLTDPANVKRLDEGTLVVPDIDGKLLARLAISWSTLGRARLGNKPWRDALGAEPFAGVDTSALTSLASKDAIVERLDNLTCMGCHQSGGTAGFHMLGMPDDRVTDAYNQQEGAFSPHFAAERARRARVVEDARAGRAPERKRPHSFFGPDARAPIRAACVKDARDFKDGPTCAAPLRCVHTVTHAAMPVLLGECVAPRAETEGASPPAGAVCQPGVVSSVRKPADAALPASTLDFVDGFAPGPPLYPLGPAFTSTESSCRPPTIGVPLGRVFRLCTEAERRLDGVSAESTELCAAVGGSKFEECATGDDVLTCLAGAVTRGMVDTCSPTRFCREDYICQRVPRALPGVRDPARIDALHRTQVGFCTPTYFLFNMRADGHPDPTTGVGAPLDRSKRAKQYRGGYPQRPR